MFTRNIKVPKNDPTAINLLYIYRQSMTQNLIKNSYRNKIEKPFSSANKRRVLFYDYLVTITVALRLSGHPNDRNNINTSLSLRRLP